MDCFKDGSSFSDVCAWDQTQAANQAGAQIRNDVAIEILAKQYVELFRPHHELH